MSVTRTIPLPIHGAIEAFAAPAIMAGPFVLGLGTVTTAVALVIGAVLLWSAISVVGTERPMSLSAHASFDYALAYTAVIGGVVAGLSGEVLGMVFLVGVGAAHLLLTATTRFSIARGA